VAAPAKGAKAGRGGNGLCADGGGASVSARMMDVEKPSFLTLFSDVRMSLSFRSLPKISAHEDGGVHQNPQYTGQHHFHPVKHDHDYCERIVINVSKILSRKNMILLN